MLGLFTDLRSYSGAIDGHTALHDLVDTVARCSSVVRAFAHGAMGRRIDPS